MNQMIKRYAIGAFLVFLVLPMIAADTVIVRSPYYGSVPATVDARTINRSFSSQLALTETPALDTQAKVLAAISNVSYPLTPGDRIELSFVDERNRPQNMIIQVDGSYRVIIPSYETIEGRNKTLDQVIHEIEKLLLTYNPFSMPKVTLIGTGSFHVTVKGEVSSTREVTAWGLTRLSSVLSHATDKASTRNIKIESADGTTAYYDLYSALKEGDLSQNPYVMPGDVITLVPAKRVVSIVGEVMRSGTYQLLQDEQLVSLLDSYAKGVLPSGDASSVLIRRYGGDESGKLDVLRVTKEDFHKVELSNMDTVYVDTLSPVTRSISVEGAVNISDASTSALNSSGRLFYQFYPQETIGEMLKEIAKYFSTVSDLSSAYLIRPNQFIPIDIQTILMGNRDETSSLVLQEGDRLIVPFNQLFVNVTGGVLRPGTFPYIEDKSASYYINLAGGFDPAKNRSGSYTITDKYGNKVKKDAPITPESVINVKLTTFEAVHGMRLATTVTIVTLVTSILTLILTVPEVFTL